MACARLSAWYLLPSSKKSIILDLSGLTWRAWWQRVVFDTGWLGVCDLARTRYVMARDYARIVLALLR